MIVLDASAAVEWLLGLDLADQVEQRLSAPETAIHAPHLLSVEVAQVIRQLEGAGTISAQRGADAMADLADLDAVHHPHEPLLPLMWDLRANLTAYDAAYVALAEVLEAPLVTLDRRMADAPGHRCEVDLIA